MISDAGLLMLAGITVVGLVILIAWCKLPAFIALLLASLSIGLCTGKNPLEVTKSFVDGMGSVLGSIAMIIALGALLGKALEISGGAESLASKLMRAFGERGLTSAITAAAFLVGIPVFFSVGLVLLVPLIYMAARQSRNRVICLGLPLVAGLSVAHGLVPPHPGPISAIGILHADLGRTIFYSLIVGLPSALICGALLAPVLARIPTTEPAAFGIGNASEKIARTAGPCGALISILLPVSLMLLATASDLALGQTNPLRITADWLGNPVVAMLAGVLFSWAVVIRGGFDKNRAAKLSEECLAPVATILLVVGAGGGFSRVLIDNGVGDAVARQANASGIPPLFLGWLLAALIRVATGSATVAITTASGFLAPVVAANPGLNRELVVLAMGAGSLMLSHVNDGGFWLVKEYLGLTVTQTLKTWTLLESAISVITFIFVLLLALVI